MAPNHRCPICGQALPVPACPNRWCRRGDRWFSVAFAVGLYQGALKRAIARYKYREERHLAAVFAGMVASYLERHPVWFEDFDVITGVPAYTGPGARRRWDPVRSVLDELVGRLGQGWDIEPDLVVKTRETAGMAGLSWAERQVVARAHLRDALRPAGAERVEGSRVLVLDDVLTDGSTLREVARVLRLAGASEVAGLVIARPVWERDPPVRGLPGRASPKLSDRGSARTS